MTHYQETDLNEFYQEAFREMYVVNTLINAVINNCQGKEFNAQYYGIPTEYTSSISNERNDYLNILNVASDRISKLIELYLKHESTFSYKRTPTIAADK